MQACGSLPDLHRIAGKLADLERERALAVVLQAGGSTPCKAGAKAIMSPEGVLLGTIGGGLVEVETQRQVAEIIECGRPMVLDFNLDSHSIEKADPVCGGSVRVLVVPAATRHQDIFATASALGRRRQRGILLTKVRGRTEWDVEIDCLAEQAITSDLAFPGAKAVRSTLAAEEPKSFVTDSNSEGERLEVLVEPVIPAPVLLIIGGGHVGQAVAAQAVLIGFDLVIIDDRSEFTQPHLFPDGATMRCGTIRDEVSSGPFDRDTYIVIVTRGHRHDADALAACIHKQVAYIGMIGSQRKVAMMRREFLASGRVDSIEFDRVYAPIGLDIGSQTVPEIAASIVAQIIAVRRKGSSPRITAK